MIIARWVTTASNAIDVGDWLRRQLHPLELRAALARTRAPRVIEDGCVREVIVDDVTGPIPMLCDTQGSP